MTDNALAPPFDAPPASTSGEQIDDPCALCREHPRLGVLSRCKACLQADADRDRQRRGHGPKIEEAVRALRREQRLPENLRTVERDRRILQWLEAHGYGEDLPSRTAIARHFTA